jgi:hypothetical protein
MKSGRVSGYKDLSIKVRPDLSTKSITEKEANALRAISEGDPIEEEKPCIVCKNKSGLIAFVKVMKCRAANRSLRSCGPVASTPASISSARPA